MPTPRVLYVALRHDYADAARGESYEHWNFLHSLLTLGADVTYFDLGELRATLGREGMARRLVEVAQERNSGASAFDAMFCVPFDDELEVEAVRRVTALRAFPTIAWFCDDHWRFEGFTSRWCGAFDWSVTTARSALPKYRAIGHDRVIKSQWACNPWIYAPAKTHDRPPEPPGGASPIDGDLDVAFVGLPHGTRPRTVQMMRDAGINVRCFGTGWTTREGTRGDRRLSQSEMVDVFRRAKVSLNFANVSGQRWPRSEDERLAALAQNQIKGRVFEVPGCGGVLLSEVADELDSCYRLGEEIEAFASVDELIDKARRLLADDSRRAALASAGLARTRGEHTWAHRLGEVFARAGVTTDWASRPVA